MILLNWKDFMFDGRSCDCAMGLGSNKQWMLHLLIMQAEQGLTILKAQVSCLLFRAEITLLMSIYSIRSALYEAR